MEKLIRVFADGVGGIDFDGVCAAASLLDFGYPEIHQIYSKSAAPLCVKTRDVTVGGGELVLEGYLLDRAAISGERYDAAPGRRGSGTAPDGVFSERGAARGGEASRLRALLSQIAAPGQRFTLAVGGFTRALYAKRLSFAAEAPFGTGLAEKFRLTAFSDDPYFHGGERRFAGIARTSRAESFPASLPVTTGISTCVGDVVIENDGDETCGIVFEAQFTSFSNEFNVSSDRESGRLYVGRSFGAGESIMIDTTTGRHIVTDSNGDSIIGGIGAGSVFFSAPPGTTRLRWNSFSDTPAKVEVRITPGYLCV